MRATIAGALLGASVGHDASRNRSGHYVTETERRCEVIDYTEHEEQLVGLIVVKIPVTRVQGPFNQPGTKTLPGKLIRVAGGGDADSLSYESSVEELSRYP